MLWTERVPGVEFAPPMSILSDVQRTSRTMHGVAGVAHWGTAREPFVDGDRSVELGWAEVSSNFFEVLGVRPLLGRLLRPEDGAAGAAPALVLSYGTWQAQFGGNPAVIGRRVQMAYSPSEAFRIVGVAPPGLDYPSRTDAWSALSNGAAPQTLAIVRLAPGATLPAARAEYFSIVNRLLPAWKLTRAAGETFTTAVVGQARPIINALTVGALLLVLIACANVANLFLVRSASRAPELAVRRALGAGVGTLIRQLLIESAIVAAAGGALGIACAAAFLRTLVALAPGQLPRLDSVRLQALPVGMAVAVTTGCVMLFGVVPAVVAARRTQMAPLRLDRRTGTATRHTHRARHALVAAQIAMALVMLVVAGLVGRSLRRLEDLPLGFDPRQLAILSVAFDANKYETPEQHAQLLDAIETRLRGVPGVTAATPVLVPPFVGPSVWHPASEAEGQTPEEATANPSIPVEIANSQYFEIFGTPILHGRAFSAGDDATAALVVVVSESVARRFWPGQDPLGKRLRFIPAVATAGAQVPGWRTVVGVVPDTRYRSLREALPMIYLPWRQYPGWQGVFALRTAASAVSVTAAVRKAVHAVDPTVSAWQMTPMDELLGQPLAQPRLGTFLLTAFGVVAILLAAIGLYGVLSFVVRERTREIGIRVALGATPGMIRRNVVREALLVCAGGIGVGLVVALATTRLLAVMLFGISPTDPATIGAVCVLLVGVAALAAYLPARRATRVDPVRALRVE